jgi:hypothetical protein
LPSVLAILEFCFENSDSFFGERTLTIELITSKFSTVDIAVSRS